MLKFAVHRYSLSPQLGLNHAVGMDQRLGALFKITWPDKKVGYGDLFPWPEYGDLSIEDQIVELSRGHLTPLMEQTIWLARRDALLRAEKKNALQTVQKIKNHYLVSDFTTVNEQKLIELKSAGFSTLKIKMGRDWTSEFQWISKVIDRHNFMLRLDFNAKGDFSTFERMMTAWSIGQKTKIEFSEDPFPYELESWTEASRLGPLALDFEYDRVDWKAIPEKAPFQFLIVKPARQDVEKLVELAKKRDLKIVFTSSMDHPIGVVHANYVAAEYKGKLPNLVMECGCLTTHLYQPNDFSSRMIVQGPYLTQVPGKGVGFDDILGQFKWQPIKLL